MEKAMYSTEEVADILGLHVRTVRGYVRDGRLPAVRIGKQYRIAQEDLDAFTGGEPTPPADESSRVDVSAVVRIEQIGPDAMTRLTTLVTGASGARRENEDRLHVHTVYHPHQASLKIIIVGTAGDTAELLKIISVLTEEQA
jgi:excisionase family DNA binding protein